MSAHRRRPGFAPRSARRGTQRGGAVDADALERDDGAPALLTRIHPHYFSGFVRDPDGHNVEFVCHAPEV